jgi:hypothetical protein
VTPREEELLLVLTHKVRFLSVRQFCRFWPGGDAGRRNALRALTGLAGASYVEKRVVVAAPELPLVDPIWSWRPGEGPPPFGAVSYQLQSRWKEPVRETPVVLATKRAVGRLGGFGGKIYRPDQAGHDLHTAAIYLRLHQTDPEAAAAWMPEDRFSRLRASPREKLPDAVLVSSGEVDEVIEFGGSYSAARVRAFHHYCEEQGYPYQLW